MPCSIASRAALGAPRYITTGNLKLDVQAPPADEAKLERLLFVTRGRPVVVAASTHPGEEEMLLTAHRTLANHFPSLLTVIVPRHPDRGEAIARMVVASGAQGTRRSLEQLPTARTDIYIADTIGELGLFYRLAPIVFMGGSLVPHGGQNPIEAVKLNAAMVHGPHVFNFPDVYYALDRAGGAWRVDDGDALTKQFGYLLNDSAARDAAAARARVAEIAGADFLAAAPDEGPVDAGGATTQPTTPPTTPPTHLPPLTRTLPSHPPLPMPCRSPLQKSAAVLHGCTVGDGTLINLGSFNLNNVDLREGFMLGGAPVVLALGGAGPDPRCAGLLAGAGVAMQRAALDGLVDQADELTVLGVGGGVVAGGDSGLEAAEVRPDRGGVVAVLEALALGAQDPLLL